MSRPLVLADSPLWSGRWDYSVEGDLVGSAGARLLVPDTQDDNDRLLAEADVVLRGGRRIDRSLIGELRRCVGIVTYSVGLDTLDVAAAAEAGIAVRNVPDYCTEEVSDHAVTLLLAVLRRLPHWMATTAAGEWLRPEEQRSLRRLSTLTVGVVGAGRIGRAVARKVRAFGMTTIAHDPFVTAGSVEPELALVDLAELLRRADAVVLCASSATGKSFLFDGQAIAALGRERPVLVNVARGSLVDEAALAVALRSGRIAAAALDVRADEPPSAGDDPLAGTPNLLLTPHVAAASAEAIEDLRVGVARAAVELLHEAGRLEKER